MSELARTEGPPEKRARVEGAIGAHEAGSSSPAAPPVTLYVACPHIHSRGELVNGFLHAHRETLGLSEKDGWYLAGGGLHPDAPLEIVHVKQSRKPFFLVEWRYPTAEELARRKPQAPHTEDDAEREDGRPHDAVPPMPPIPAEALRDCAQRLLALGSQEDLQHKEAPVKVQRALPGATVAAEREKLLLRDEERKRKNAEASTDGSGAGAPRKTEVKGAPLTKTAGKPASTTSFVPRTVRRPR